MKSFTYNHEFTWELLIHIPKVYGIFLSGGLGNTCGVLKTKPFYYFHEKHQEDPNLQRLSGGGKNETYGRNYVLPYQTFPPYKDHYLNVAKEKGICFQRPLITINNKSSYEWGRRTAQNRIELNELEIIIKHYSNHDILYIRPDIDVSFPDIQKNIPFEDKEFLKQFDNVYVDTDLEKKWQTDFNTVQLIAHALSEQHFSIAGGNAVLASYFGGTNVIVGKTKEIFKRSVWHTDSYLKNINKSKIIGVLNTDQLKKVLDDEN